MTQRLILIVCSDDQHLHARYLVVRHAGYWGWRASTLQRALSCLRKVRPALVLTDAALSDGRGAALLQDMRALAKLDQVPVAILGVLTPHEQRLVGHDAQAHVWQVDDHDGGTLVALLDDLLAGSRSRTSEWSKPGTESDAAHSDTVGTTPPQSGFGREA